MMRTLFSCLLAMACAGVEVRLSSAFDQKTAYEQAREKYQSKRYPEALAPAEEAVRADGGKAASVHLYGLILEALQRLGAAEENLRKAAALAPDQAAFQYDLGYLLHQERKYVEAQPVLKRAVELDPENLMARFMLARTYVFAYHELQIPNFAELTLEQLNFIVKKNPRFPAVHHHLALVYINGGEPGKAIEELNTELRFYPENTQARLELGETLLRLNQYHKAAEEFLAASKQAPQMPAIQYGLAKAYKADGQTVRALTAARRCVELDAKFADGHYLLGQLYRDTDQTELARQEFDLFRQMKTGAAPSH
jgi:tetratricopeptide (TPR) repeat protein